MNVVINGDSRDIPEGLTVTQLLDHLKINAGRVAIERNLEIVLRAQWESTPVEEGDRLEIVNFVGGG